MKLKELLDVVNTADVKMQMYDYSVIKDGQYGTYITMDHDKLLCETRGHTIPRAEAIKSIDEKYLNWNIDQIVCVNQDKSLAVVIKEEI